MFLRPLPLLTQVCADEFALRRFARIAQAVVVLGIACTFVVVDAGEGAGDAVDGGVAGR